MARGNHMDFCGDRLRDLQTAIFTDFSDAVLKFPTNVISIENVDNLGNIFFRVRKPYRDTSGMSQRFFARLQFYNRKFDYYITVEGWAVIVPGEDASWYEHLMHSADMEPDEVLIGLHTQTVDYSERTAKEDGLFNTNFAGLVNRTNAAVQHLF